MAGLAAAVPAAALPPLLLVPLVVGEGLGLGLPGLVLGALGEPVGSHGGAAPLRLARQPVGVGRCRRRVHGQQGLVASLWLWLREETKKRLGQRGRERARRSWRTGGWASAMVADGWKDEE